MIGGIEQFLTCWHTLSLLTLLIPLSLHSPFTISPSLARPILKIKKNNPKFEKVKILSHRKCHLWIVMNIVFIFFFDKLKFTVLFTVLSPSLMVLHIGFTYNRNTKSLYYKHNTERKKNIKLYHLKTFALNINGSFQQHCIID